MSRPGDSLSRSSGTFPRRRSRNPVAQSLGSARLLSRSIPNAALRQRQERIAFEALNGPFVHWLRTDGTVDAQCHLVPVQHRPLHTGAAALDGQLGEGREQLPAQPASAELLADEKVLEIEAWTAAKRGVPSGRRRQTLRARRPPRR